MNFLRKTNFLRGLYVTFTALFAILFGLSIVANQWSSYIDEALGTTGFKIVTGEAAEGQDLYPFKSDFATTTELAKYHKDLGERIGAEGTVLLKNKTGSLPLANKSKVTLLGIGSRAPLMGGQMGSGYPGNENNEKFHLGANTNADKSYNIINTLKSEGFSLNPDMISVYNTLNRAQTGLSGTFRNVEYENRYQSNEASIDTLSGVAGWASAEASIANYNDAAIIVISRPGSEGRDYYPGQDAVGTGYRNVPNGTTDTSGSAASPESEHYGTSSLGLSNGEKSLVEYAKTKFNKIIVLINATSAMEIDELKNDDKITSIVWVGIPGAYGFLGVAGVLSGRYNPSGHLPDTYAVDAAKSPAAQNMGIFVYKNKADIGTTINARYGVETATGYNEGLNAVSYLVEAEGIYVGYKYYETRYYDQVKGQGKAAGTASSPWTNYNSEVSYTFGYGLSYTTFSQALSSVNVNIAQRRVTATVRVTNTGTVAGKDVVQLYYQSPYTQYNKDNKVEKSAIELLDFEKTDMIQPGEYQDITIVADMQYMASYDYTKAKTYILDYGDYYFGIGNGAHDALNNIMARQGLSGMVDVNGAATSGTSAKSYMWTYSGSGEVDKVTFSVSKNGTPITNQLDDADFNYYKSGEVTYLSRSDWQATFPKQYHDLVAPSGASGTKDMIQQLRNDYYSFKTDGADNGGYTFGATTGPVFQDMFMADYDDERWDDLLNRMTIGEMWVNIAQGGNHNSPIQSINAPKVWQNDGPNGNSSSALGMRDIANTGDNADPDRPFYIADNDPYKGLPLNTLPNNPVIAATFSKELTAETGKKIGNDALWSNNAIIWAGGFNIHRTPFNGRNHEYYSEDPMLSNLLGQEMIAGSLKYGVIIGPKHFAFNDQDSNRYGISPFMHEQKAREGDLRAFQGAMENGALGVMTTFSRIGATAFNGHIGVMQNILREEWGFKGLATTDMVNGTSYFQPKECIMGGITMMAQSTVKLYTTEECDNLSSINANYDLHWKYMYKQSNGKYHYSNDDVFLGQLRQNWHYQLYALSNSLVVNGNSAMIPVTQWWKTALSAGYITSGVVAGVAALAYVTIWITDRRMR